MDWKYDLKKNCKNGNDLKGRLPISENDIEKINIICKQYPMLINEYYLSLINPNDSNDPIKKMCIPSSEEIFSGGVTDSSGEKENTKLRGLQHKYEQTALILISNECFMYCRHCFRKRIIGLPNDEVAKHLNYIKEYIKNNSSINNVLLSGGDSLFNSNETIAQYLECLTQLKQLDFIRFGSRAPVVFPQRIYKDEQLLHILKQYNEKKQLYIITQFNHPKEVTSEAILAVKTLQKLGIIVKNQTVLLKGINDSVDIMSKLLINLTSCGVIPYYIFQCRPVQGVYNHFQVPLLDGYKIVEQAKNLQNGQGKCVRYVLSHTTGKIEIIGNMSDKMMIFKYHQAKDVKNQNKIFIQDISSDQCWI